MGVGWREALLMESETVQFQEPHTPLPAAGAQPQAKNEPGALASAAEQEVTGGRGARLAYRSILEGLPTPALVVTRAGRIVYCNRRCAVLLAQPPEKLIGSPLQRHIATSGIAPLEEALAHAACDATPRPLTLRLTGASQAALTLTLAPLESGAADDAAFCGTLTDQPATPRTAAEHRAQGARGAHDPGAAEDAQEGWLTALDAAGMGSWELNFESGQMRRSLRHDQLFGYETFQRRWDTRRALAHFVPEDREALKRALAEARLTGTLDIEVRIKRASDRALRWLQIRGQTFYEHDVPLRIAGVICDVTERRSVEERLRQTQRIEALGQLTGGVAHDFNNLLQVVCSGLYVIGGTPDGARRSRVLASMMRAVEHGASLCRQLLSFSRRQPLRPEPIDLPRLVEGMRELLARSLRGDITLKTDFARRLWPVEVDAGEMELVLLNLALNARDALPAGGIITIRAYNVPALGDHELSGDYVRLDVIDAGVGMTAEVLSHAFEPFFTTKETGQGSGLGLAQAHGFARASGGAARIESAPGLGTTVSLYLPRTLREPIAPPQSRAPAATLGAADGTGQVLVVEDDDEVAAMTVEMIRELGYDTTRVASAEAALGALADQRAVDVVFSDFMMPGSMNGVQLAQEIRRRRPDLPVLLTSGFAEAAQRSLGAQQIHIISKPYRMDELRDALRSARRDAQRTH